MVDMFTILFENRTNICEPAPLEFDINKADTGTEDPLTSVYSSGQVTYHNKSSGYLLCLKRLYGVIWSSSRR